MYIGIGLFIGVILAIAICISPFIKYVRTKLLSDTMAGELFEAAFDVKNNDFILACIVLPVLLLTLSSLVLLLSTILWPIFVYILFIIYLKIKKSK